MPLAARLQVRAIYSVHAQFACHSVIYVCQCFKPDCKRCQKNINMNRLTTARRQKKYSVDFFLFLCE